MCLAGEWELMLVVHVEAAEFVLCDYHTHTHTHTHKRARERARSLFLSLFLSLSHSLSLSFSLSLSHTHTIGFSAASTCSLRLPTCLYISNLSIPY
jgi:hypothetical protein